MSSLISHPVHFSTLSPAAKRHLSYHPTINILPSFYRDTSPVQKLVALEDHINKTNAHSLYAHLALFGCEALLNR